MSKLNRRKFVKTAVAGAAVASTLPSIASAQDNKTIRLRLQSFQGKDMDAVFDAYSENIKEATGGSVRIKRYPGSALVPDTEMLSAVSNGTLDMSVGYGGYWPGKVDMAFIEGGIPGGWFNYDQADYLFRNGLTELIQDAYAEQNIKYIGVIMGGPFDLLTKEPVKSLEDMKNMKIRATPAVAQVLQQFDIPTVFMPGSELYVGLSTGAVDGVIYGGPHEYFGMKLYEVAKYYTSLDMVDPGYTCSLMMNMDKWNGLSAGQQKDMELAYRSLAGDIHAYYMRGLYNPKYKDLFEFSKLPPEDTKQLLAAAKVIWEEEAKKSERTKKAIDLLKAFHGA